MMFTSDYMNMLIICSALGVGKGIRSVYMSIVIPSYIPLDRLASASAIQLFGNGVVMMCIGPVLGVYTFMIFYALIRWIVTKIMLSLARFRTHQRYLRELCWLYTLFEHLHTHHNYNVLNRINLYLVQKGFIMQRSKFQLTFDTNEQYCLCFLILFKNGIAFIVSQIKY